jgi:hypothetical protein
VPDPPGTQWLRSERQRIQNDTPAFTAASRELQLTPQEQFIYRHHLANLAKGGVRQPGGDVSTFLSTTVGIDGRSYILPTVWGNRIVTEDEAVQMARMAGLQNFPSYASDEEAEARYKQIHPYFERDLSAARRPYSP